MKKISLPAILLFLLVIITSSMPAQNQKIVILKLDDVTDGGKNEVVSTRWQRVADYLEKNKIKASFGIIGYSLVKDNPRYFKWITDIADRGYIEFWNHGFYNRTKADTIGEFEGSYRQQLRALQLTDSLAKAKLKLNINVWGVHWSKTNEDTDKALAQMPQIQMTFGNPRNPIHYKGYVMPNNLDMEYPVHNPNFETFIEAYKGKWKDLEFFYLQGHPNSWDDMRWNNFVKIVEFLKSENVRFVTPSEFLELTGKQ